MDNRPIGVFDSGIGGLSCIKPLLETLPNERIIFFGDTARTPYGSKTESTIIDFSLDIADFLVSKGAKMLIIACNTISAVAPKAIAEKYPDIPVIPTIPSAAKAIASERKTSKNIGLIATKVTVNSKAYENELAKICPELKISSKACPALVPLIEEGLLSGELIERTLCHYLDDFIEENKLDTLVLGCTHYPFVESSIRKLYPSLKIINPADSIAFTAKEELKERGLEAEKLIGRHEFYASDISESFTTLSNAITKDIDLIKQIL